MKKRDNIITVAIDSPAAAGAGTEVPEAGTRNGSIAVHAHCRGFRQFSKAAGAGQ